MAPFLDRTKQVAIISAPAEGSGIRQIERMTGVHRDTIMRPRCALSLATICVIRGLHGVESSHVESVPIKEVFQGRTVWEGVVEVFDLKNHPKAARFYAWAYETDNPKKPRHVTVLHMGPVTSPLLAVGAAIVQEFKSLEP